MRKLHGENGLLSLEACISVTIFLFFMLFLYSFFIFFEARNKVADTLLSTAEGLALDKHENEMAYNSNGMVSILQNLVGDVSSNEFRDTSRWYTLSGGTNWDGSIYTSGHDVQKNELGKTQAVSPQLESAVKKRFIAYLSGGDVELADRILKRYHIVDGIAGIKFEGTHMDTKADKLYIRVEYEIEYEFNVFGLGKNKMEQQVCSKIWK